MSLGKPSQEEVNLLNIKGWIDTYFVENIVYAVLILELGVIYIRKMNPTYGLRGGSASKRATEKCIKWIVTSR